MNNGKFTVLQVVWIIIRSFAKSCIQNYKGVYKGISGLAKLLVDFTKNAMPATQITESVSFGLTEMG